MTTKDTSVLNASPHWAARHRHEGSAGLLVATRSIGIMALVSRKLLLASGLGYE